MSGLVAVLSRSPETLGRAPAALSVLCHTDAFESRELATDRSWLGVCGRAHEVSLAAEANVSGDGGRPVAAVAGEFANRAVLKRGLGLAPDAGAAEIALAAYRRWGRDLFAHLEGVFAVVVDDPARDLTLAGPDSYGVMFLHVTRIGSDILIATEAKAFLVDPRFRVALDEVARSSLVVFGHEYGRGLFAGVEAAQQGCHFEIDGGATRSVRHWWPSAAIGELSGDAYVTRLSETVGELAAEAYGDGGSLLPLTGGLDSRLLAASRPHGASVSSITFGTPADADYRRAKQIAAACGFEHQTAPFEPDNVARHALGTTWVTEGRLSPAEDTTGFQMRSQTRRDHLVSGVDCGVGRRYCKTVAVIPNRSLLGPGGAAFETWLKPQISQSGMSGEEALLAFGSRAEEVRAPGNDAYTDYVRATRGLCGVDRLDLYFVGGGTRGLYCPGLDLAAVWLTPRAPFLTRRWIEAVLSGAPSERLDELALLRLICRLDPAVARVPWVMTSLPLRESRYVLRTLRGLSRLRPARPVSPGTSTGPSARRVALSERYKEKVKGAHRRIYDFGHHRAEWLRVESRDYVEAVLLSERFADRGFADPQGVRRLVAQHMAGRDHTHALSTLLGIELWHRLFVDGERPDVAGESSLAIVTGQVA